MFHTMLGYEEMRNIHEERLRRSLTHYRELAMLDEHHEAASNRPIETDECLIIDLPTRVETPHRLGA